MKDKIRRRKDLIKVLKNRDVKMVYSPEGVELYPLHFLIYVRENSVPSPYTLEMDIRDLEYTLSRIGGENGIR